MLGAVVIRVAKYCFFSRSCAKRHGRSKKNNKLRIKVLFMENPNFTRFQANDG
jgi:hypothetical protein